MVDLKTILAISELPEEQQSAAISVLLKLGVSGLGQDAKPKKAKKVKTTRKERNANQYYDRSAVAPCAKPSAVLVKMRALGNLEGEIADFEAQVQAKRDEWKAACQAWKDTVKAGQVDKDDKNNPFWNERVMKAAEYRAVKIDDNPRAQLTTVEVLAEVHKYVEGVVCGVHPKYCQSYKDWCRQNPGQTPPHWEPQGDDRAWIYIQADTVPDGSQADAFLRWMGFEWTGGSRFRLVHKCGNDAAGRYRGEKSRAHMAELQWEE